MESKPKHLKTFNKMSRICICRACLDTTYHHKSFIYFDAYKIALYNYTLGLQIGDKEPCGYLCPKCVEDIENYGKFKKQCLKANTTYLSLMQNELLEPDPLSNQEPVIHEDLELNEDNFGTVEVTIPIDSPLNEYKNEFENHLERCNGYTPHMCGLCGLKESNQDELINHFLQHFYDDMLKCKLCTFRGRDFADMLIHSYEHTEQTNKSCPCCSKKFVRFKTLEFHFRSDHLYKKGGLCSFCNKDFATSNKWLKHERLHLVDGYVCDHCGRKFLYRKEIVTHLREVAGIRPYMCDSCGLRFKKKVYLKQHMDTQHKDLKPVKCNHCNKQYKSEAAYQKHVKDYKAERTHQCPVCNKTFVYARQLQKHAFFHTDTKPYQCNLCQKYLKTKASFKEHGLRHAGVKQFKCKLCDKAFVASQSLKVHQSVHTGVRRHQCSYCSRSFNERKLLNQHCLKVHKIELEFG